MTDAEIQDLCERLRSEGPDPEAQHRMFLHIEAELRALVHPILRRDFSRVALMAETDDVLHDVLCKMMPYLRQGGEAFATDVATFRKLTATVLRRTLIGLARKHYGSLRGHPLSEPSDAIDPGLAESSGLDGWRSRLRIHELIDQLEPEDREVIELAMYTHLANAEMARCLGVSPGQASRRFSRAKERLGLLLAQDEQKADSGSIKG